MNFATVNLTALIGTEIKSDRDTLLMHRTTLVGEEALA